MQIDRGFGYCQLAKLPAFSNGFFFSKCGSYSWRIVKSSSHIVEQSSRLLFWGHLCSSPQEFLKFSNDISSADKYQRTICHRYSTNFKDFCIYRNSNFWYLVVLLYYPRTDFLIDGRRIGLFREARITTGWLLSDRNSRKCNLI